MLPHDYGNMMPQQGTYRSPPTQQQQNMLMNSPNGMMAHVMNSNNLQQTQRQLNQQALHQKPSVVDYCQAILSEHQQLLNQINNLQVENATLNKQKIELQELYTQSQQALLKMQREYDLQTQMSGSITTYISSILDRLPIDAREEATVQLDRIKTPIPEELRPPPTPTNRIERPRPLQPYMSNDDDQDDMLGPGAKKQKVKQQRQAPKVVPAVHPPNNRNTAKVTAPSGPGSITNYETTSGFQRRHSVPSAESPNSSPFQNNDMKQEPPDSPEDRKEEKSPLDENSNVGMPRTAQLISTLPHGDVVCALSIHSASQRVYTAGKGTVKVWDLNNLAPTSHNIAEIKCLGESYIRSARYPEMDSI